MEKMILNETPVRTARSFNINNIELKDFTMPEIGKFENIQIHNFGELTRGIEIEQNAKLPKPSPSHSLSQELTNQIELNANSNLKIKVNVVAAETEPIMINYNLDNKNPNLVNHISITADENAKAKIYIVYRAQTEQNVLYHNGLIEVNLAKNSSMDLYLVNFLSDISYNLDCVDANLAENSKFNLITVDLGGKYSITNYNVNLVKSGAEGTINTVYLGRKDQVFDINDIASMSGEKNESKHQCSRCAI